MNVYEDAQGWLYAAPLAKSPSDQQKNSFDPVLLNILTEVPAHPSWVSQAYHATKNEMKNISVAIGLEEKAVVDAAVAVVDAVVEKVEQITDAVVAPLPAETVTESPAEPVVEPVAIEPDAAITPSTPAETVYTTGL